MLLWSPDQYPSQGADLFHHPTKRGHQDAWQWGPSADVIWLEAVEAGFPTVLRVKTNLESKSNWVLYLFLVIKRTPLCEEGVVWAKLVKNSFEACIDLNYNGGNNRQYSQTCGRWHRVYFGIKLIWVRRWDTVWLCTITLLLSASVSPFVRRDERFLGSRVLRALEMRHLRHMLDKWWAFAKLCDLRSHRRPMLTADIVHHTLCRWAVGASRRTGPVEVENLDGSPFPS